MTGHISDTRPLVIAIVGSGPRGISVLERLAVRTAAEAERAADGTPPRPVRIHLIDATEVGAGRVWRTDQDDWFTMNTVVSQVTMYSGDPDGGPARPGAGPRWASGSPSAPCWARSCSGPTTTRRASGTATTSPTSTGRSPPTCRTTSSSSRSPGA